MTEARERRQAPSRSREVSLEGLQELAVCDHATIAAGAREALRCVVQAGADPRLMLLVIEAAVEGEYDALPGMMGDRHWTART